MEKMLILIWMIVLLIPLLIIVTIVGIYQYVFAMRLLALIPVIYSLIALYIIKTETNPGAEK